MKGGLINIDYVCQRFVHEDPNDPLGELLPLVHQLYFPFDLRAVNDLGLSIGGHVLKVDLANQPGESFESWSFSLQ